MSPCGHRIATPPAKTARPQTETARAAGGNLRHRARLVAALPRRLFHSSHARRSRLSREPAASTRTLIRSGPGSRSRNLPVQDDGISPWKTPLNKGFEVRHARVTANSELWFADASWLVAHIKSRKRLNATPRCYRRRSGPAGWRHVVRLSWVPTEALLKDGVRIDVRCLATELCSRPVPGPSQSRCCTCVAADV